MDRYQHFINGAWVTPDSGKWFASTNPYTGEDWAEIAEGNAADVDRAVAAAKTALSGPWGKLTATERGKRLDKLAELIEDDAARLAEFEVRDNGKLLAEMGGQTRYIAEWFRYYGGLADKLQGAVIPTDKPGFFTYTK